MILSTAVSMGGSFVWKIIHEVQEIFAMQNGIQSHHGFLRVCESGHYRKLVQEAPACYFYELIENDTKSEKKIFITE